MDCRVPIPGPPAIASSGQARGKAVRFPPFRAVEGAVFGFAPGVTKLADGAPIVPQYFSPRFAVAKGLAAPSQSRSNSSRKVAVP